MKSMVIMFAMLTSIACFADGLKTNQAYLEEIKDVPVSADGQEVSRQIVSDTDLVVKSEIDNNYELKPVSQTHWCGDAQMYNVKDVSFHLNENGPMTADVTIVQLDGNAMGTDQTQVEMSCEKTAALISCESTIVINQHRLVLAIGR